MNSQADVWAKILSLLEKEMTSTAVTTWFDDAVAVDLTDDTLVLYTPVPFKHVVISRTYLPALKKALFELFAKDFEVRLLRATSWKPTAGSGPRSACRAGHRPLYLRPLRRGKQQQICPRRAARAVADNPPSPTIRFLFTENPVSQDPPALRHRAYGTGKSPGLPHRFTSRARRFHNTKW